MTMSLTSNKSPGRKGSGRLPWLATLHMCCLTSSPEEFCLICATVWREGSWKLTRGLP